MAPVRIVSLADDPAQEGFKKAYPIVGQILAPVVSALARPTDRGALAALYAAVSPGIDDDGLQAAFLDDPAHVGSTISEAEDDAKADEFWRTSQEVIKQVAGEDALISWSEGTSE